MQGGKSALATHALQGGEHNRIAMRNPSVSHTPLPHRPSPRSTPQLNPTGAHVPAGHHQGHKKNREEQKTAREAAKERKRSPQPPHPTPTPLPPGGLTQGSALHSCSWPQMTMSRKRAR